MSTYAQFIRGLEKNSPKRVTWVGGPETVLVEEVVDAVAAAVAPGDLDHVRVDVAQTPVAEVWASVTQVRADTKRLVVIRNADRIATWGPLLDWLDRPRETAGSFLLFVSGSDLTRKRGQELPPHLSAVQRKGHLVRCSLPNAEDLVWWVQRHSRLDETLAKHLLNRAGASLAAVRAVCQKVSVFPGVPSKDILDLLVHEVPADWFCDELLAGSRADALHALTALPVSEYPRTLGLLDSRLDQLGTVHQAMRRRLGAREMASLPGVPAFLVPKLEGLARDYDDRKILRRRQLLALAEDAYHSGARVGVLEALACLW